MENSFKFWFELWLNENLKITLEIFSLSKFDLIFLAIYIYINKEKEKEKGCLLSADYYYFCKHKQKEQTKLHSTRTPTTITWVILSRH
jgi:hypothetical protein